MQGFSVNWQGPEVLLLALPQPGALDANGGGRALALALLPGQEGGDLRPPPLPI